jgi:phytoene synthase
MTTQPVPAEPVRDGARAHAADLYLSALLAPRAARGDLITLAAFAGEMLRIPVSVTDPTLATIRVQWWRDAIAGGARTGNPLADALIELMARRSWKGGSFEPALSALDHYLERGVLTEAAELDAYLDATVGEPIRLAASVLDVPRAEATALVIAAAGQAYGRARLALELPYHLARGRWPVPLSATAGADPRGLAEADAVAMAQAATSTLATGARHQLAEARRLAPSAHPRLRYAIRPLALVEPYFDALQKPGRNPLREPADLSPLVRATRLWLASWSGVV